MTESDEDPLVAVDIDENEGIVTGKEYALAKNFSEVKVVISPYSTYEQAVAKNSAYKYSDYHNYTDNNNPGINSIICGILEEGGAMAWICTNCGTYTMRVTNVASNDVTNTAYNDKICEEKLHSLLSEVSIDESLTDEVRK